MDDEMNGLLGRLRGGRIRVQYIWLAEGMVEVCFHEIPNPLGLEKVIIVRAVIVESATAKKGHI